MANDKHLYELDELTTPQSNDLVMVEKSSNNKDMKVKMSNLMDSSMIESILAQHSEWTTTVQDGSITEAKLYSALLDKINSALFIDNNGLFYALVEET